MRVLYFLHFEVAKSVECIKEGDNLLSFFNGTCIFSLLMKSLINVMQGIVNVRM